MISKNSFSSLMKEDMKSKMWLVLINVIILFLNFPIAIAMQVQAVLGKLKNVSGYEWKDAIESLAHCIGAGNKITLVLTIGMAFLAAISQFGYLYHRNQVDLYHSLPISRKRAFFVRYFNGIIVYALPYLVFCVIAIAILSASGFGQMAVLQSAFSGFALNLIGYILCYSVGIVAVCLTGNIFVGLCGIATFSGYGIVLSLYLTTMMGKYSDTFMQQYVKLEDIVFYVSPIAAYGKISSMIQQSNYGNEVLSVQSVILWAVGCLAAALVITFLGYLAYVKRKSENAGKSIAFKKAKGMIKGFLMTLIVCCGTLIFETMSYGAEKVWQVIGFILSLVLAQIMIQVIFELDIKAITKGMKTTGISAVIAILIFVGFYFGGKSYDNYQIDWNEMEYAAVNLGARVYGGYNNYYYDVQKEQYLDLQECIFRNMKLEEKELVKELTKECIADSKKKEKDGTRSEVSFKYTLKNGRAVYRKYEVSYDIIKKYVSLCFENQSFRKGINNVFQLDTKKIEKLKYYEEWSNYETKYLDITKEEIPDLIEVYKEEFLAASFEDLNENVPVFSFIPCVGDAGKNGEWELTTVYVYPSFTKTIELLRKAGMEITNPDELEISNITISKWEEGETENSAYTSTMTEVSYSEPEKIEELRKLISFGEYGYYTNFDGDYELKDSFNVSATIGNVEKSALFVRELPKWLEEDIKNAKIEKELKETE